MYENYTYEYILNSILDRIVAYDPTIDVREGSAMWYAVAPVALELAIAYTNCDAVSKESFVGTATREGLYRACEDIGLNTEQFDASAGVFLAYFDGEVARGSRWACGDYIFYVTSKVKTEPRNDVTYHYYRLVCETVGSHTQYTNGTLRPITDYGSNTIRVAVLDSCEVIGADETSDEFIRDTYFDYIANKSEGGNIAQYSQWLSEFDGVGAHKVIPNWNGANTVKVVVVDENKQSPTPEFIASVQNYLDPNQEGLGEGKAPIGAIVTVDGGVNVPIDIQVRLALVTPGANASDITENINAYFREIAFKKSVVNIYEVASRILSSPSVSDVDDVMIRRHVDNSADGFEASSITLNEFEVPVLANLWYDERIV